MMLDVRSIAFVTTVNMLIFAMVFFIQWLREHDPSLRDWAIAFTMGTLGCGLTEQRDAVSNLYSIAIGGTLLFLIYVFTYLGLCRIFGSRPSPWIWVLTLAKLALYVYFIKFDFNPPVWPMITGYTRFIICAWIFFLLWKNRRSVSIQVSALLMLSMLIMGFFMLGRAIASLWIPQSFDFSASSVPAITYFVTAACTIAMMLGLMSLHVEQLHKKLENAANTDVLTGLRNRRFFNELAAVELDRCKRSEQAMWLLLIDIDHFKSVNDRFGHAEGDSVLKRVSEVFRESLRSFDLLARYGGEEFCVLLSNSEAATAQSIAQRLSYLTADLRAGPQRDHPVTISIGATALEDNDRNVDDLMKRADHALYQAKCSGRNCIIGFANALDAP